MHLSSIGLRRWLYGNCWISTRKFFLHKIIKSLLLAYVLVPKRGSSSSKSHNPSDDGNIKYIGSLSALTTIIPCAIVANYVQKEEDLSEACCLRDTSLLQKKKTESNLHKITSPAGECSSKIISSFYPSVAFFSLDFKAKAKCDAIPPSQLNKA